MSKYFDLKIESDDLKLDEFHHTVSTCDRDSIGQDVKHMIRETGYLVDMIGERNPEKRRLLLQKIMLEAETDERIVPGTVSVTEEPADRRGRKRWLLRCETYEYGPLAQTLEAGSGEEEEEEEDGDY